MGQQIQRPEAKQRAQRHYNPRCALGQHRCLRPIPARRQRELRRTRRKRLVSGGTRSAVACIAFSQY